ncbi:MAG: alpha/beta hydrolase [Actinobacteria bacterium]|nr:alpha/beta hydrolase [Actinomycetota bacterium]
MSKPEERTLEAPGAVLAYDVRQGAGGGGHPVLLLIGAPMGASGFAALAEQFADRTVVTYDPRGTGRSQRTDGQPPGSEPGEHAEDLRRLIQALGAGPADIFGSSGGAVNALALVARHPRLVATLVAHEPPAAQELPDREAVLAACAGIRQTYQHAGFGPAMATFIALASHPGPIPPGVPAQPAPDPAAFGLPARDDGSRDDPLLGLHMTACVGYQHDVGALAAAPTRIVLGVGAQSGQMLAGRAAAAVAGRLGTTPVTFPGGHDGFLSDPGAFATVLRTVLDG